MVGGLSSLEQAGERKVVQRCFAEFCGFGKVFPVVA